MSSRPRCSCSTGVSFFRDTTPAMSGADVPGKNEKEVY